MKRLNGDEVVKQLSLPQTQLGKMEPSVCLVSTKLNFVTVFTDFSDAIMWVYDSFRFGTTKAIQRFLFFFCGNLLVPIGLTYSCISTKKHASVFFVGLTALFKKMAVVNLNSQCKYYDSGASVLLSKITAVSAELPAILKINAKSQKKSNRARVKSLAEIFLR